MRGLIVRLVVASAAVALVAGCAATVKRDDAASTDAVRVPAASAARLVVNVTGAAATKGADWSGFRDEWAEKFGERARGAGIAFAMQDGAPRPVGEEGTLLEVQVADYRFIRPGTRYAVGVMSGNAYIESTLVYRDLKTGEMFGRHAANTSSSAWEGVFSAMTDRQVDAIAADVFATLQRARASR